MSAIRLLVNGAKGRMGQMIIACAEGDPEVIVSAAVDQGDDFSTSLKTADVVIEFSHHDARSRAAASLVFARASSTRSRW